MFLLFGVIARRGAAAGLGGDPVPQAMVITGIVVAFAATALAVALLLRLYQKTGRATLHADAPPRRGTDGGGLMPDPLAASTPGGCLLVLALCPAGRRRAAGGWRSAGGTPSASPRP